MANSSISTTSSSTIPPATLARPPMLEAGVRRSGRTIADLDRMVPYWRIGKPEEVAALVAFLASDEAAFICGSLAEITGAQSVA